MEDYYIGCLVRAQAGRDKGGLYLVVDMAPPYLLLSDGKRRRVGQPKRKKLGHVTPIELDQFDHPTIGKLKQGQTVSDRELRLALAAVQGGNHAWRKTI